MTQYWGDTRHVFLLTLYNFKNIGGHVPPPPPRPHCSVVPAITPNTTLLKCTIFRRVGTCKPGKPGLTSFSETLALFFIQFLSFRKMKVQDRQNEFEIIPGLPEKNWLATCLILTRVKTLTNKEKTYRKIPIISPRRIFGQRAFLPNFSWGGLIFRGGLIHG